MLNLVLFGPPGAGKGTQSEKLIAVIASFIFRPGIFFGAEVANQTTLGIEAKKLMDQGFAGSRRGRDWYDRVEAGAA